MVSGPSGVGKGTVVKRLLERHPDLFESVSVTTREARRGERDGVDYRFVSDQRFGEMVAAGELLEWAHVVGHRSGTPAEPVKGALAEGRDVVLEIDVQGARQVRERMADAVLIFLAPPSIEELERRLRSRGTEDEDRLALRLATARKEMQERSRFDHVVVNDRVEEATAQVEAIIQASRTIDEGRAHP